jgi:hypothetical protein
LASVRIDRTADTLGLGFCLADGSIVDFGFEGVIGLRIADTLLQNVVSRLFLVPPDRFPADEIKRILVWMFSLDGKLAIAESMLDAHIADVLAGAKTLFYVEPSWGAEIGILCTSVSRSPV